MLFNKKKQMKVIHICGDSGVGKSFLLQKVRAIEAKQGNGTITQPEESLLKLLEIGGNFAVCGPAKKGFHTYSELEKEIYDKLKSEEFDTIVHHWQHPSHPIFYLVHQLFSHLEQKSFVIWRDPRSHLSDLLLHRRDEPDYDSWSVNDLKRRVKTDVWNILNPVVVPDWIENKFESDRVDTSSFPALNIDCEAISPATNGSYKKIDPQIFL